MDQTALLFILLGTGVLTVLFVHELGHLLVARRYGIKVLSLSVGFGPQLINFTDRIGTGWKLRAFPLGGSCILSDDSYETKETSGREQADHNLRHKCARQRAAIHAAGPVFNVILAALFVLVARYLPLPLFGDEIGLLGLIGVRLIAEFSIATALFNLLPFLPLDGGQLCLTTIEAGLGRPLSPTGEKCFRLLSTVSLAGLTLASLAYFVWAFSHRYGATS